VAEEASRLGQRKVGEQREGKREKEVRRERRVLECDKAEEQR